MISLKIFLYSYNIISAVLSVIFYFLFSVCSHLLFVICEIFLFSCAVSLIGLMSVVPAH
jgi:hypothetical protein